MKGYFSERGFRERDDRIVWSQIASTKLEELSLGYGLRKNNT